MMEVNSGLAWQVEKHRLQQGCFNDQHMCRFRKLASLPGFMGSLQPEVSIASDAIEVDAAAYTNHVDLNIGGEGEEEKEDDQQEKDISAVVLALLSLTLDKPDVE